MLTAYYDLARNPPTYDVVTFLLSAERERIRRGEDSLAIEIVPGPQEGFRQDKLQDRLWPYSTNARKATLANIVVPMCTMLPSVKHLAVHDARPKMPGYEFVVQGPRGIRSGEITHETPDQKTWGWMSYTVSFYQFVVAMGEGVRPLRPREPVERDSQLVTITLREAEHWPLRNSKVAEWHRAATHIRKMGFRVEIVRDTRLADKPLGGMIINPVASRDLHERANLYHRAYCNLFVSNGPAWFALALDANVLVVRPTTEGVHRLSNLEAFTKFGIMPGEQIPSSPSYQRLAWVDDTAENIIVAFEEQLANV